MKISERQQSWLPDMTKKIKKYVEGCDQYQKMKNRIEVPAGKPMPNTVPEKLWEHIYYGGFYNQVTVVARSQFYYNSIW